MLEPKSLLISRQSMMNISESVCSSNKFGTLSNARKFYVELDSKLTQLVPICIFLKDLLIMNIDVFVCLRKYQHIQKEVSKIARN